MKLKTTLKRHLAESTESSKYTVLDWMRYRAFGFDSSSQPGGTLHVDDRRINSLIGIPETVYRLRLHDLQISNLNSGPEHCEPTNGSSVEITNCNKLTSLAGLPRGLQKLTISDCDSLKSLDIDIPLTQLNISGSVLPDCSTINVSSLTIFQFISDGDADLSKLPKFVPSTELMILINAERLVGSTNYRDFIPTTAAVLRFRGMSGGVSFAGINKHLTKLGDSVEASGLVEVPGDSSDLIGFTMIDGIKSMNILGNTEANKIFNKYLREAGGKLSRSQVLSLRKELTDEGFERYAGI